MTELELAILVDQLRALAEKHDCLFVAELPPGAGMEQIDRVEEFVGASLPLSLRNFLQMHDGMALHFYQKSDRDAVPFPLYEFFVFGTEDIISWTSGFRNDYIDTDSDIQRQRMYRCFDIANLGAIAHRIFFWLDAPRAGGEYAIIKADLHTFYWLNDLDSLSQIAVANSFDEFLDRCLRFMLKTEGGFWYWAPCEATPDAWLW